MAAPSSMAPPPSDLESPAPYLFGGVGGLLGLVAFSLLILALSFWKCSGVFDDTATDITRTAAGHRPENSDTVPETDMEEKFLVIMAGEVKPTHLATTSSRTMSFGNSSWRTNSTAATEMSSATEGDTAEAGQGSEGGGDQVQGRTMENRAAADRGR